MSEMTFMAKASLMSPLRKYRIDKGWKLKQAAPFFKISVSYLSDLETGTAAMTVKMARKISARTKGELTVLELLGLVEA